MKTRLKGFVRGRALGVLVSALVTALVSACAGPGDGEGIELRIRLQTDLAAGSEFTSVRTQMIGSEAGGAWDADFDAESGMDFGGTGVVVGTFRGLPKGSFGVRLLLLDARGLLVATTEQIVTATANYDALFLVAKASCENAWCGDNLTCVNGMCLPKSCVTQPALGLCANPKPPSGEDEPLTATCTPGDTASCSRFSCSGTRTCAETGVWGVCELGEQSEICNGADDDCDGVEDNPVGGCGSAVCTVGETSDCAIQGCTGERTCLEGGVWGACDVGATAEICDGKDNDCDGITDNSTTQNCQAQQVCTNGQTRACSQYSCSGSQTCVSGAWSTCSVPKSNEVCNGKDDDCNGATDDIAEVACEAACGTGTVQCVAGAPQCTAPRQPSAEVCDGVDNNCDGTVDNIPTEACSTACEAGTYVCGGGGAKVCTARQPSGEVPNGVDDDCNGQVDNGRWVDPIKLQWADLQAHNFGCNNAFSPWWQCQQVADAICQGRGYLGGFGPVDWDDGGTTGVWIECIGKGSGASRATINVTHLGKTEGQSMGRQIENDVRTWCFSNGYGAAVGTVKWHGNNAVDVICLPSSLATYVEVSAQWLTDRGCGDINAALATPICSRAAHLTCIQGQGGKQGIGPFWVWGNTGLVCLADQ